MHRGRDGSRSHDWRSLRDWRRRRPARTPASAARTSRSGSVIDAVSTEAPAESADGPSSACAGTPCRRRLTHADAIRADSGASGPRTRSPGAGGGLTPRTTRAAPSAPISTWWAAASSDALGGCSPAWSVRASTSRQMPARAFCRRAAVVVEAARPEATTTRERRAATRLPHSARMVKSRMAPRGSVGMQGRPRARGGPPLDDINARARGLSVWKVGAVTREPGARSSQNRAAVPPEIQRVPTLPQNHAIACDAPHPQTASSSSSTRRAT